MLIESNVTIPVAFLLSSAKSTETYQSFFEHLYELSEKTMKPSFIVCDFERVISEAATRVWHDIIVLRDAFHFFSANIKWAKKRKISDDLVSSFSSGLRHFFYSVKDMFTFETAKSIFLGPWDKYITGYSAYFEHTWVRQFPPSEWAPFANPDNPGTERLEAWHSSSKCSSFGSKSLEFVVDTLFSEFDSVVRTLSSDALLLQKQGQVAARQRKTLKNYVPPAPVVFSQDSSTSTVLQPSLCSTCKQNPQNKNCNFSRCADCCKLTPFKCKVARHNTGKSKSTTTSSNPLPVAQTVAPPQTAVPQTAPPEIATPQIATPVLRGNLKKIVEVIEDAIQNETTLNVMYAGGTQTNPRKLTPISWQHFPWMFEAFSNDEDTPKFFATRKVKLI